MESMDVEEGAPRRTESTVPLADVASHGVVVPVPMVCVNCDERHEDRAIKNFRVIEYGALERLMDRAKCIETADYNDQLDISEWFVGQMLGAVQTQHRRQEYEEMLNAVTAFGNIARSTDLDKSFVDASTEGITFDPIRRYVNDKTGLLVRHEAATWCGLSFYSQFGDDEPQKALVRREMNETDLNQMYYILERFEQSLMFHKSRTYNYTIKLTNLCLFYMALIESSLPIENMCDTDLTNNILGYITDVIVRSRVITKWRLNPSSRSLIQDIVCNYDSKNHMVAMCRLETPRERAEYTLKILSESPQTKRLVANLSYGDYEKALERTVLDVDGGRYYVFKRDFINGVVAFQLVSMINTFDHKEFASAFKTTQAS